MMSEVKTMGREEDARTLLTLWRRTMLHRAAAYAVRVGSEKPNLEKAPLLMRLHLLVSPDRLNTVRGRSCKDLVHRETCGNRLFHDTRQRNFSVAEGLRVLALDQHRIDLFSISRPYGLDSSRRRGVTGEKAL